VDGLAVQCTSPRPAASASAGSRRPRSASPPPRQWLAQAEAQLAQGWPGNAHQIRDAIAIALDFHTWHTLTHQRGLSRNQGIQLMLAMVEGAA
jgi:hypothetical protein